MAFPYHPLGPHGAFMLFRCEFVHKKSVLSSINSDHHNISGIVGRVWCEMNDEQRAPWVQLAEKEQDGLSRLCVVCQRGGRPGDLDARILRQQMAEQVDDRGNKTTHFNG